MDDAEVAPGLTRLLEAAAARLERNGLRAVGRVCLEGLTADEVGALSGLLGSRWRPVLPGATATVSLAAVDDALRRSGHASTLAAAAAAARAAPLVDRRAERDARDDLRDRGWAGLDEHPALARHPALRAWLERERATGAALRSARAAPDAGLFGLLTSVLGLLTALPADPPLTLARFAAARCGDPHALDRDTALDRILRRALVHLDGDEGEAKGAEARRRRYDRWGIGCDELSSTVLCAGLRPVEDGLLATGLRAAAAAGEPRVVTLRELRGVSRLTAGDRAFCCENPDVVAAAVDDLGVGCPPLVCTGGWPSTACVTLLRALRAGGALVHHHGDMDPEGLRILDHVVALTGGRLWRVSVTDYEHAASGPAAPVALPSSLAHPELAAVAAAIRAHDRCVREEQVLGPLLVDLRGWQFQDSQIAPCLGDALRPRPRLY